MRNPIYVSVAIAVGIVVLLGYFFQVDLLLRLRVIFLEWATVLVAVALIAGVVNLFQVHWRKFTAPLRPDSNPAEGRRRTPGVYSLILVTALSITLVVVGWFGPTHPYSLWIFNNIQLPVETSLMAILAVVLIYAGVRLSGRRLTLFTGLFLGTAVVILLVSGPLFAIDLPGLAELRSWIARVPATAGARGLILGVGLGIVTAGLRVLSGVDRPYEG
jgi:hypothetical protein